MDVLSRARKSYAGAGSVRVMEMPFKSQYTLWLCIVMSVFAVTHLLRGTANLTLNSDESQLTRDKTQLNTVRVNDMHLDLCSSLGNVCSYFIEWEVLVFHGSAIMS